MTFSQNLNYIFFLMSYPEYTELKQLIDGFVSLYNEKSPISFTLVAASILEDQVLRTVEKIAPGFHKQGAITHCHRVHLLYCTGTITKDVASALESFAKIRNAFAHKPHTTSFNDNKIGAHAKNLRSALDSSNDLEAADGFWRTVLQFECKFTSIGHEAPWSHDVSRTILGGYIMLSFYLIWARHRSNGPNVPPPMSGIAKQIQNDIKCATQNS